MIGFIAAGLVAASFQSKSVVTVPQVVAPLAPPKGEALLLRAFAEGAQVYECRNDDTGLRWAFIGPEAELTDDGGHTIGKHYAGPTWEAIDGSTVKAEVVTSVDATDPSAIPHLLLKAKENGGNGVFAKVRSIQRLHTNGGRAPREACLDHDVGRRVRMRYLATYYFYGDPPAAY